MMGDIKIGDESHNIGNIRIEESNKKGVKSKDNLSNEENNQKITDLEIINAVERINHAMKIFSKKIRVNLQKRHDKLHAQIIDAKTQELVRDIPIDKVMQLDKNMEKELGVFVDKTA